MTGAPPNCSALGRESGAAAVPPIASGGGESRGNLLGPALGLPGSFCSLPEKSSNKAAQRQDTGSFQPSLTAVLEARLWLDPLCSGPVWPDPLLQTSAGTNPAEEVAKAPVLQGFPQPWPACCREESPRDAAPALSCCPSELQLLAALSLQTDRAAADLQRGYSGPLQPPFYKPASSTDCSLTLCLSQEARSPAPHKNRTKQQSFHPLLKPLPI